MRRPGPSATTPAASPDAPERLRRPRDSQRQRCYDAEASLPPSVRGRSFGSVAEMQRYVDGLAAVWPLEDAARIPPVRVGAGSGSRRARAVWDADGGHRIQVPRSARTELVLLHEVAHVVTSEALGFDGCAAHGWQWARCYLQLVGREIGEAAGDRLEAALTAHGVRYEPPR